MTLKEITKLREPCQIFSRIVGYYAPLKNWSEAKQAEYADRKVFKVKGLK